MQQLPCQDSRSCAKPANVAGAAQFQPAELPGLRPQAGADYLVRLGSRAVYVVLHRDAGGEAMLQAFAQAAIARSVLAQGQVGHPRLGLLWPPCSLL